MARCSTCGNNHASTFEVKIENETFTFDCFECAIHKLAPRCTACGCRIIGHGIRSDGNMYCSTHCARARPILGWAPRV